jgi:diaminohydroxyphosphoribosylaminopyrimidine deaminase/5-amino-6-(5-phosphoribosylamino)uracil reductase
MSSTRQDDAHMLEALRLASKGRGRTSPNPMVGAVIVDGRGTVVGIGYHERAGGDHAEVRALAAAGKAASGATLYCTLEPCCHRGRTGPCVDRIVDAGVARVVVAMPDPNPAVNGKGIESLRRHGITVAVGLREREAARLNEAFVTWVSERRPFVTLKVAASLDGRIAARPGARTALTSPIANRLVHVLRAEVDAVGVGSTTLLVDDPLLTARETPRGLPLTRVIFDRRLRTPPTARIFGTRESGPIVVLTEDSASAQHREQRARLADAGADVECLDAGRFLPDAFERLAARGVTSLVLEGGRRVHEAAWDAGLVDRVQIFVAPVELGPAGVAWMDRGKIFGGIDALSVRACGPDLLMEADVHRTH